MDFLAHVGALTLGSRLKRLSDRLMREVADLYDDHHIDFEPRWFPLTRLLCARPDGITVADAAADLGVSHANVSQVAKRMESKGMLTRSPHPDDGRKTVLRLSEHGQAVVVQLRPRWSALEKALADWIGTTGFLATLTDLEEALDERPLLERLPEPAARPQVQVEPWRAELAPHFRRLNQRWIEDHFVLEPHDHELLGDPQGHIIDEGGEVLFAVANGEVVGTLALIPEASGATELSKMAVDPACRGLGIGRTLMEAALATCTRRGWSEVYLVTNSALAAAVALYRSVGFREVALPPDLAYERVDLQMVWKP